jgi:hypothetical protein
MRKSERTAYENAFQRCNNRNDPQWHKYGGRGIKMLFASFADFFADIGPKPDGYYLDRIDNNGHYEAGNVHWVTPSESVRNRNPVTYATHEMVCSVCGTPFAARHRDARFCGQPCIGRAYYQTHKGV